jgi:hypothetical protein
MRKAVFVAGLALTACVGSGYVEADVPPADIEVYPYTYYDGQVVYLVGDRWYTRHNDVWVYYRTEPTYLRDYRVHYQVRTGRPVYHYRRPYYGAPPERRVAPVERREVPVERREAPAERREAPPAERR